MPRWKMRSNDALACDNGSGIVKADLAGDDAPRATVEFFLAVTGEKLCTHKLCTPCTFTGDELPRLLGIQSPLRVLVDGRVQASHEVMLHCREVTGDTTNMSDDVIKVEVALLPYRLVNTKMDPEHPCGKSKQKGHRRFYKEFREFAASGSSRGPKQ